MAKFKNGMFTMRHVNLKKAFHLIIKRWKAKKHLRSTQDITRIYQHSDFVIQIFRKDYFPVFHPDPTNLLALIHDIGKISPEFQKKIRKRLSYLSNKN